MIGWFSGVACTIAAGTPRSDLATSFSYNLGGAKGRLQLREAVDACPMHAYIQSDDSLDLAVNNESDHQPLTQVTVTAAAVGAGDRFAAHVTLYYESTKTAVFDPCPMFWAIDGGPPPGGKLPGGTREGRRLAVVEPFDVLPAVEGDGTRPPLGGGRVGDGAGNRGQDDTHLREGERSVLDVWLLPVVGGADRLGKRIQECQAVGRRA